MREKFKKGEIVSAARTFNGEIITGEFLGYHLFNDENPDTVVGIVDVPGDRVYDVDVTSLKHYVKSTRYSDDEKIRNEIIDFFRSAANGQTKVISGANSLMWADWLEKQKEQKPVGDGTRAKIVSRATSEKQVVLVSESDGNAEIGWDTRSLEDAKNLLEYGISFINKQLGVKPAEWSEEDKAMLAKAEQIVLKHWNSLSDSFYHKYDDENQDAESCYDWLKSLHGRFGLQPKQEWSKEDEEMRNLIITIFEANHPDGFFKANELGTTDMRGVHTEEIISWLKSLRPQPKQEWSEEDKKTLNAIISVLREIKSQPLKRLEDWDGYIRFLESLRPHSKQELTFLDKQIIDNIVKLLEQDNKFVEQEGLPVRTFPHQKEIFWLQNLKEYLFPCPSWKPSEKQMDALLNAEDLVRSNNYPEHAKVLAELYEQLKTL